MTVEERRTEISNLALLKKLIDAIELTEIINKKKAIIRANSSNELFIKTLFFLTSDRKTGITSKNIGKKVYYGKDKTVISHWDELMDYLNENNLGTDKSIMITQRFLFSYPKKMEPYLIRLITKDFVLTLGAKTINEALSQEYREGN